jgi:hypothetical protein
MEHAMEHVIKYDDLINRSSDLLNYYNNNGIRGRYINRIAYSPFSQIFNIIMKLEIDLTNIDNADVTTYIFFISNKGKVFSLTPYLQLKKILIEWINKCIYVRKDTMILDCGVIYPKRWSPFINVK